MEREANYAAVGAFVLLVTVLGSLFVYWYSDSREHRDYKRYEVYFEGTVSGLERGSAVRYLGVNVGRVYTMRVDPRDPSRVQVIVDIDASAPISRQTVAELSLQGVTGLLYIDLATNTAARRLSRPVASLKYPVIRSARSNFDLLVSSLPELVGLASNVAERASLMLSDKNIAAVDHALSHIDAATSTLPQTAQQINALVLDLRSAVGDVRRVTQNADRILATSGPEVTQAIERVHAVADNLARASAQLSSFVEENRKDLRMFTRDSLPEFDRFLRDGREAAQEIRDLARSLHQDPSQLIYQPIQQGVEIPR